MTSLGCVKNLVDAETILGETLDERYTLETDAARADVILINTCGFIEEARAESRQTIEDCLAIKKANGGFTRVVAIGCLAQRYPDELRAEFPELDAVWGLSTPSTLRRNLAALAEAGGETSVAGLEARREVREGARLLTTGPSYAYLRIADGCDNRCRYCAIPLIRGDLRSRSATAIIDEAKQLEQGGVKELVVIAQDITAYGMDGGAPAGGFAPLLGDLLAAVSVPRVRLLYAHPAHLDDATIDLLLGEPRLCRYIDLPFQHVADPVLARMGRGYTKARLLDLTERFGKPGFTLRTTFLVGFPGETEADFLELLTLVEKGCFQHMGAFAYSPEPGTPAFDDPAAVPAEEAERRLAALMEAQTRVAYAWLDKRVGGTERVLVDGVDRGSGYRIARGLPDAPDADGIVYLEDGRSMPGAMVDACIIARDGYDLVARPARQSPSRHGAGRARKKSGHRGNRRRG